MKVYIGNRIDGERDLTPVDIAGQFVESRWSTARPGYDETLDFLPLERRLRDFMTHPDGLNCTWEDEDAFDQVWDIARNDEHVEAGERNSG